MLFNQYLCIANILNTDVNSINVVLIVEIKCLYDTANYFEKKKIGQLILFWLNNLSINMKCLLFIFKDI